MPSFFPELYDWNKLSKRPSGDVNEILNCLFCKKRASDKGGLSMSQILNFKKLFLPVNVHITTSGQAWPSQTFSCWIPPSRKYIKNGPFPPTANVWRLKENIYDQSTEWSLFLNPKVTDVASKMQNQNCSVGLVTFSCFLMKDTYSNIDLFICLFVQSSFFFFLI